MRPERLVLPERAGEPDESRRLLSPEAAFLTLSMLHEPGDVIASSGGRTPVYKKTGTSNGFRDAWTAGVVGQFVLVVWVGNFDNASNPLLVGGEAAAPLFGDMARALGSLYPLTDPAGRNREGLNLRQVEVCRASGDPDTSLCADVVDTLFIPGVSPVRSSGIFRTILIDRETGLRACEHVPGRTEERVLEFWPTDMRRIFLRAGIVKAVPPPFSPECAAGLASGSWTAPGKPPRINIPKEGVTYRIQLSDPSRSRIPLTADADADANGIFWFAGDSYLGRSEPGKHLPWTPPAGVTELRAVDDLGRAARQTLSVLVAP
jgi:penicillin-binding protein 1C